jgi:mannan endo-1,4-beta-mannosidase
VRLLALNLLTCSVTLALLVGLALPAKRVLDRATAAPEAAVASVDTPWPRPAAHPGRVFGVYVDPWHVDDWARAVGAAPQLVASFDAFSRRRTLAPQLAEAQRQGIRRVLITWEPWRPVPVALGTAAQAVPQPGYRNIEIARGAQDDYMFRFARSLRSFPGTVYLRYGHEMNGYWYPWSHGPQAYVWAWRRMVRIFRLVHADNVRFVWSVNPSLYDGAATWRRGLAAYWPGRRYVDVVGSTMIDFGGVKSYPVAAFAPRLRWLHAHYRKPVALTGVNTAFQGRLPWLRDLHGLLARSPWIGTVVWSQLPSRGRAHQAGTGVVDWDVTQDPAGAGLLRAIIDDSVRRSGERATRLPRAVARG